jgi:hypothetical protein
MKKTCCVLFFTKSIMPVTGFSRFLGMPASLMKLISFNFWHTCTGDAVFTVQKQEHKGDEYLIDAHFFQPRDLAEVLANAAPVNNKDVNYNNITSLIKQPGI